MENESKLASEEWEDVYVTAKKIFDNGGSMKRKDLDPLDFIQCQCYSTIFDYDPYEDKVSFIPQRIEINRPVNRKLRHVTIYDLQGFNKGNAYQNCHFPFFVESIPLAFVPPNSLFMFSKSFTDSKNSLKNGKFTDPNNLVPIKQNDIIPGDELLYKHKTGKLYRVLVLMEVTEENNKITHYDCIFLDKCLRAKLSIKKLYNITPDMKCESIPSSVFLARICGIASFRKQYAMILENTIEENFSSKSAIKTVVYKADECGLYVIDYLLEDDETTMSEAVQLLRGYSTLCNDDPERLSYDELAAKPLNTKESMGSLSVSLKIAETQRDQLILPKTQNTNLCSNNISPASSVTTNSATQNPTHDQSSLSNQERVGLTQFSKDSDSSNNLEKSLEGSIKGSLDNKHTDFETYQTDAGELSVSQSNLTYQDIRSSTGRNRSFSSREEVNLTRNTGNSAQQEEDDYNDIDKKESSISNNVGEMYDKNDDTVLQSCTGVEIYRNDEVKNSGENRGLLEIIIATIKTNISKAVEEKNWKEYYLEMFYLISTSERLIEHDETWKEVISWARNLPKSENL